MSKIIDDNYQVCEECASYLVNGDVSGLSYHYNEQEVDELIELMERREIDTDGHICLGDSDKDEDFSHQPCDHCRRKLAGARVNMVILSKD